MTTEFTAEEIVTNLLTSHQILKKKNESFSATNYLDLNGYLKSLPPEEINKNERTPTLHLKEEADKYTFIKECHNKWVV